MMNRLQTLLSHSTCAATSRSLPGSATSTPPSTRVRSPAAAWGGGGGRAGGGGGGAPTTATGKLFSGGGGGWWGLPRSPGLSPTLKSELRRDADAPIPPVVTGHDALHDEVASGMVVTAPAAADEGAGTGPVGRRSAGGDAAGRPPTPGGGGRSGGAGALPSPWRRDKSGGGGVFPGSGRPRRGDESAGSKRGGTPGGGGAEAAGAGVEVEAAGARVEADASPESADALGRLSNGSGSPRRSAATGADRWREVVWALQGTVPSVAATPGQGNGTAIVKQSGGQGERERNSLSSVKRLLSSSLSQSPTSKPKPKQTSQTKPRSTSKSPSRSAWSPTQTRTQGRAVQFDPIKLTLKAPVSKRL